MQARHSTMQARLQSSKHVKYQPIKRALNLPFRDWTCSHGASHSAATAAAAEVRPWRRPCS